MGDAARLKQVLLNLTSNAIKFTEQGRAGISVALVRSAPPPAAPLRFSVRDTGMDPATQAKLFQVVSEGDSSMTRRFGGTGPALPSPNDSSTAWADTSTYRVGPTKARNSVSNSPGPSQRPTPDIPVRRCFPRPPSIAGPVLVVADDHVNQCVIELLLQKIGLSCVVVSDSASAVELARIQPWDATLMDCQMPGMDGCEATRRSDVCWPIGSSPSSP